MLRFHTKFLEIPAFSRHFNRLFPLFNALAVFSDTLAPASIYRVLSVGFVALVEPSAFARPDSAVLYDTAPSIWALLVAQGTT